MKTALGAILITACSFALGLQEVNKQRCRSSHTKTVLDLLVFIKDGITVFRYTLPEIFRRFGGCKEDFKSLLTEKGLLSACQTLSLSRESLQAVEELALTLGTVDLQTQKEKLDICIKEIELEWQKARENYRKHSKSVLALYILAGALTVLILL